MVSGSAAKTWFAIAPMTTAALVNDKYAASYGGNLAGWRGSALPVAVDLLHEITTTAPGPAELQ